jgi:hypothetical protein
MNHNCSLKKKSDLLVFSFGYFLMMTHWQAEICNLLIVEEIAGYTFKCHPRPSFDLTKFDYKDDVFETFTNLKFNKTKFNKILALILTSLM